MPTPIARIATGVSTRSGTPATSSTASIITQRETVVPRSGSSRISPQNIAVTIPSGRASSPSVRGAGLRAR